VALRSSAPSTTLGVCCRGGGRGQGRGGRGAYVPATRFRAWLVVRLRQARVEPVRGRTRRSASQGGEGVAGRFPVAQEASLPVHLMDPTRAKQAAEQNWLMDIAIIADMVCVMPIAKAPKALAVRVAELVNRWRFLLVRSCFRKFSVSRWGGFLALSLHKGSLRFQHRQTI